jgi:hypothetical protein
MPSVLYLTCQRRDYIGADNAGLYALLLREGPEREGCRELLGWILGP